MLPPIQATLLARWDEGYQDPWLILTDFSPLEGNCEWYGTRCWIECGYRENKSDGWLWQNTRMRDPNRADRHWLAMAISTLWMVSLGSKPDVQPPYSSSGNQADIQPPYSSSQPDCSNPVEPVDSTVVKRPVQCLVLLRVYSLLSPI